MGLTNKNKYLKIAAGLSAAVALAVAGYFIYTNIYLGTAPKQLAQDGAYFVQGQVFFRGRPAPRQSLTFKGNLYLSLVKNDGKDVPNLYTYDLGQASSSLKMLLLDKTTKNGSFNLSPSVSPDGERLVFARVDVPVLGKINDTTIQIYTSDISGKNVKQITNTPEAYKREPIFSPSGNLIAYIARDASSDPDLPESWTTFLTDGKGSMVKVANGCDPIFSPNGKTLLILQKNGVYSFNINEWKKPVAGKIAFLTSVYPESYSSKMTTSPDGKMIAVSSQGGFFVARINWDTFKLDRFMLVDARAVWLSFSPDSKYLAVDEWRKDEKGNEYPIIMGYDLSNGLSETIINLSEYDKSYIWLGSWK